MYLALVRLAKGRGRAYTVVHKVLIFGRTAVQLLQSA
jgi:hypothetical protein